MIPIKRINEILTNIIPFEISNPIKVPNTEKCKIKVVPSFLLFVWYKKLEIESLSLISLIILSSFPVLFGAIRLAKYNAIRNMRESVKYIGMPTPANAIFICSLILFAINFFEREMFSPVNIFLFKGMYFLLKNILFNEFIILGLSIFSSILLMSKVDYNKFPLISFKIDKKNSLDLINLILFCLIKKYLYRLNFF